MEMKIKLIEHTPLVRLEDDKNWMKMDGIEFPTKS